MTLVLVLAALGLSYGAGVKKKVVTPKDFPIGRPFGAGLLVGHTLYVSGSTGGDLKTGKVPEKFEDEVQLCFDNIGAILQEGGMGFGDAVSVQVYLTDRTLFPRMNVGSAIARSPPQSAKSITTSCRRPGLWSRFRWLTRGIARLPRRNGRGEASAVRAPSY